MEEQEKEVGEERVAGRLEGRTMENMKGRKIQVRGKEEEVEKEEDSDERMGKILKGKTR